MGEKSAIEWTDATWNPVTGCSKVSPGCAHCYAEALSLRYGWSTQPWTPEHAAENVVLHPERLDLPIRWRGNKRIFVNSMSDLFHERVPDAYILQVFAVMAAANNHTFQVLTKRPERMHSLLSDPAWEDRLEEAIDALCGRKGWCYIDWAWPLANVWLGTSVENQRWADERIPLLLDTPAAVRFLSCEPLLGPLDLEPFLWEEAGPAWAGKNLADPGLDWIIGGGESGPHYRPCDPAWARALRDQCRAAEVAFLWKQWGGRTPKAGGRLLDGRTWDEYPQGRAVA